MTEVRHKLFKYALYPHSDKKFRVSENFDFDPDTFFKHRPHMCICKSELVTNPLTLKKTISELYTNNYLKTFMKEILSLGNRPMKMVGKESSIASIFPRFRESFSKCLIFTVDSLDIKISDVPDKDLWYIKVSSTRDNYLNDTDRVYHKILDSLNNLIDSSDYLDEKLYS